VKHKATQSIDKEAEEFSETKTYWQKLVAASCSPCLKPTRSNVFTQPGFVWRPSSGKHFSYGSCRGIRVLTSLRCGTGLPQYLSTCNVQYGGGNTVVGRTLPLSLRAPVLTVHPSPRGSSVTQSWRILWYLQSTSRGNISPSSVREISRDTSRTCVHVYVYSVH